MEYEDYEDNESDLGLLTQTDSNNDCEKQKHFSRKITNKKKSSPNKKVKRTVKKKLKNSTTTYKKVILFLNLIGLKVLFLKK